MIRFTELKTRRRCHAKLRAFERFGISLNRRDRERLNQLIRAGKTLPSKGLSIRLRNHVLWFGGTLIKVGYDKKTKGVVTFLYPTKREIQEAVKLLKEGKL